MTADTYWTFHMPRFLLYVYLRREAKAGFEGQGWILCLRFISTGGTLWDRKRNAGQKAAPGSRPKGKQMPWGPTSCHHWEASQAGNKSAHSRPWGRTVTSPSPAHIQGSWRQGKRERKGWGDEGPTNGSKRGESKDPPRRARGYHPVEATGWLAFQKSPKAWETQFTHVHTAGDPPRPIWVTYRLQRTQKPRPEQVAHTWPCDLVTPQIMLLTVISNSPQFLAQVGPVCLLNGALVSTV